MQNCVETNLLPMEIKTMPQERIIIVDDEPDIALLFSLCLGEKYAVSGFTDGEHAIAALQADNFSVAIVDLRMAGLSGIDLIKQMKVIKPTLQIVIFTGYPSSESAIESVNNDAFRYLQKPFRSEVMHAIVDLAVERYQREVALSKTFVPTREDFCSLGLKPREIDVAMEILKGRSSSEIAELFFNSKRTIETHVQNIFERLNVSSKLALNSKLQNPKTFSKRQKI